jgi:hypothetical protein
MGEVIVISSHPKWSGQDIDIKLSNSKTSLGTPKSIMLPEKKLSKLQKIQQILEDQDDYISFLEACIDKTVYDNEEEFIQNLVDDWYDNDDGDGGDREVA